MKKIVTLSILLGLAAPAHAVDRADIVKEYLYRNAVIDGTYQPDRAGEVMANFSALTTAQQNAAMSNFVDTLTAEIDANVAKMATETARLNALKAELETFKAGL